MKIAVCDDELSEIKRIKEYITRFSFETGIEFMIDRYSSGKNLIQVYNRKTVKYDILFLDVEMPELNGIKTAQKIREIPDRNVLIIFITSYPEYMQDSFDVQASQYLTKPLSYQLFKEKFQKIIGYINEIQTNIAVVSLKKGEILLYLDEIVCFETIKSVTTKSDLLVTTMTEEFEIKGKIAEMEAKLKDQFFISVHRSVLVNMKYIKKFNANLVELTNGKTVEISRRKLPEVKDAFSKYMVVRYKK
ncbi:LytTR family DNA-binding domain-containing protein [Ruminococcus sp. Marseille-P6503]|uniref:LytR/AlgR family response regulator transcription factor n=1 Tax=Ruminococcus sp. Marseille-P6503 TaxID=2364796 RepID=UPI0019D31A80|nr:LytTR family DNA-binding domain-containing protein [Ruminococcus sp. Marseille-P6503]